MKSLFNHFEVLEDPRDIIRKNVFNLAKLDKSMGEKLTLKQKMTRYTSNFKNIENLIFNVINYCMYLIIK